MRIVNRNTFLQLPSGTVYSKYDPCVFELLCLKQDTICSGGKAIDWFYVELSTGSIDAHSSDEAFDKLSESERTGCEVSLDFETLSRDGCFNDDQLFAVMNHDDVLKLLSRIDAERDALQAELVALRKYVTAFEAWKDCGVNPINEEQATDEMLAAKAELDASKVRQSTIIKTTIRRVRHD